MKVKPLVSVVIPTHNRKEKLTRLLNSVLESNYPKDKLEIIVVDDVSTDGTHKKIKTMFPKIKIIRNEKELLPAGCRNVGIKNARGKYIFLIDDDNIVDENCILELVKIMENDSSIGIVAPIMYYLGQPKRIWCAGLRKNKLTSHFIVIGKDKIDMEQFNKLIESDGVGNAFMIKKEVKKFVLFDDKIFPIHYEEADFSERVRRLGYRVIFNPKAKIWHDIPLPKEVGGKARIASVHNELRAYYTARNRIIFHKKYSKWWQFLFLISFFIWPITLSYLKIILFESSAQLKKRLKIAAAYLKGILDGLKICWKSFE